jgi:7-keto-8-aminopelargonate synthetase-like enzyme
MSPANTAAVLAALHIMRTEPERIAQLWKNTNRMKHGLLSLGFDLGSSETPILPVYTRDMLKTFQFCRRLQEEGIFINPVVSPGVPPGQELLRVSLMATHTSEQIDRSLEAFQKVGKELALI